MYYIYVYIYTFAVYSTRRAFVETRLWGGSSVWSRIVHEKGALELNRVLDLRSQCEFARPLTPNNGICICLFLPPYPPPPLSECPAFTRSEPRRQVRWHAFHQRPGHGVWCFRFPAAGRAPSRSFPSSKNADIHFVIWGHWGRHYIV